MFNIFIYTTIQLTHMKTKIDFAQDELVVYGIMKMSQHQDKKYSLNIIILSINISEYFSSALKNFFFVYRDPNQSLKLQFTKNTSFCISLFML